MKPVFFLIVLILVLFLQNCNPGNSAKISTSQKFHHRAQFVVKQVTINDSTIPDSIPVLNLAVGYDSTDTVRIREDLTAFQFVSTPAGWKKKALVATSYNGNGIATISSKDSLHYTFFLQDYFSRITVGKSPVKFELQLFENGNDTVPIILNGSAVINSNFQTK